MAAIKASSNLPKSTKHKTLKQKLKGPENRFKSYQRQNQSLLWTNIYYKIFSEDFLWIISL